MLRAPAGVSVAVILLVFLFVSTHPASAQTNDVASQIRALEGALFDAMRGKASAELDALLAPEFVLRGTPDVDRETWIRNAVGLCWGDRMDIEDFRADPIGETVVASFQLTFYVDPATCQPATFRSLLTDIWVREGSRWRLRVRHSGPPPAGAGVAGQFGLVPEPPPRWEIDGELSFVATGGNTSTSTLGFTTDALHRGQRSATRGSFAFVRSEAADVTQARSLLARVRHGIRLREHLEVFGQLAFAQDRFAGIDGRTALEAGLAYTRTLPHAQSLTIEGGLGYTIENRIADEDLDFASANGTARYAWTIRRGLELTDELNAVVDLESAGNWRGRNVAAMTAALTRLLSLRASHTVEYRNEPVESFGRTDTRTAVALVVSLRRR